ncbi:hypothetical protein DRP07_09330 [Archaeoglobales archaeon]|nr:MAG: hypothetical protein DRP07_09330 [Archaeoglobales archaeon]
MIERRSNQKFLCDRMLGKLATWLRISGYDTVYIGDLNLNNRNKEDTFILKSFRDRIVLTRDRELYRRCLGAGRDAVFVNSDIVLEQLKELEKRGVEFKIVMDRCSVCNGLLRKPTDEEIRKVLEREGISEDLKERYELWYCKRCEKLYWMGSHWRNMVKFLEKVKGNR